MVSMYTFTSMSEFMGDPEIKTESNSMFKSMLGSIGDQSSGPSTRFYQKQCKGVTMSTKSRCIDTVTGPGSTI